MSTVSAAPVRVAGAGPAGLAAAITLARAGRAVEVLERRARVGDRFLGGFQMLENGSVPLDALAELDALGIGQPCPLEPAHEAVLFDHRLRPRSIRSARPYGYFLRRGPGPGTLDRGLLAVAESLGVRVRFGEAARPGEADVVATGPAVADGLARELTFETDLADRTWVLFDQRLAPGGYAYLFVRSGFATFGTAIVDEFRTLDERFARCLARFQSLEPFTPRDGREGYSMMNFTLEASARQGSALLAGEAAGFQDFLFGLGIRYAIVSGALAGRALATGGDYDALWRERLAAGQETSLVNRFLYEVAGNAGLADFARRAAGRDFREYLLGWQRPVAWKRPLAAWLRRRWRRADPCRHTAPDHWCRRRPRAAGVDTPPPGPIAPIAAAARAGEAAP